MNQYNNDNTGEAMLFSDFINNKLGDSQGYGQPVSLEELTMIYSLFYPREAFEEGLDASELPVTRISHETTEALMPALRAQVKGYQAKTHKYSSGDFGLTGAEPLVFKERLLSSELYRDPRMPGAPAAEVVHPQGDEYYVFANGTQPIDLAKNRDFVVGNVIKYIPRVGRKHGIVEADLLKAIDYTDREIAEDNYAFLSDSYSISPDDAKLMLDILPSLRHSSYRLAFYYAYRGWLGLTKLKLHEALIWEMKQGNI